MEVLAKTFLGRIMRPLIRMGLRKRTGEAAANLKTLLESPAEQPCLPWNTG
jgi:hypothetical protein